MGVWRKNIIHGMRCRAVGELRFTKIRLQIEYNIASEPGGSMWICSVDLPDERALIVECNHERDAIELSLFTISFGLAD